MMKLWISILCVCISWKLTFSQTSVCFDAIRQATSMYNHNAFDSAMVILNQNWDDCKEDSVFMQKYVLLTYLLLAKTNPDFETHTWQAYTRDSTQGFPFLKRSRERIIKQPADYRSDSLYTPPFIQNNDQTPYQLSRIWTTHALQVRLLDTSVLLRRFLPKTIKRIQRSAYISAKRGDPASIEKINYRFDKPKVGKLHVDVAVSAEMGFNGSTLQKPVGNIIPDLESRLLGVSSPVWMSNKVEGTVFLGWKRGKYAIPLSVFIEQNPTVFSSSYRYIPAEDSLAAEEYTFRERWKSYALGLKMGVLLFRFHTLYGTIQYYNLNDAQISASERIFSAREPARFQDLSPHRNSRIPSFSVGYSLRIGLERVYGIFDIRFSRVVGYLDPSNPFVNPAFFYIDNHDTFNTFSMSLGVGWKSRRKRFNGRGYIF